MPVKKIREITRRANEGIKEKVRQAKDDKRHIALIVVELVLIALILVSLLFLFDPDLSFSDAGKLPWPLKLFLFLCALAIVVKLYSYTSDFRSEKNWKI
ncbi:MAG: hypothetical protein HY392_03155 [Candidatus Diapherotrites archaeon]|nr:hypothetical protein [Candidatus Diapherotrites archaeon]